MDPVKQPVKKDSPATTPRRARRDGIHCTASRWKASSTTARRKCHGWKEMGRRIRVRCFRENPSVKSSLTIPAQDAFGGARKS